MDSLIKNNINTLYNVLVIRLHGCMVVSTLQSICFPIMSVSAHHVLEVPHVVSLLRPGSPLVPKAH